MRKLIPAIALLLISTITFSQSIIRGPYLQSPNWNSIKVMWRTDSLTASHIKWGTSPSSLTNTVDSTALLNNHIVKITGLQNSTTYYYAVADDAGNIVEGGDEVHRFKTWPMPGTVQPIRVWGIGDFGKGNDKQAAVRNSYMHYPGASETDVWIWLGDNAYQDGTDAEFQNQVFDSVYGYDSLFTFMPFMPSPGNHDYNSISPITAPTAPLTHHGPYLDLVEVPRNGECGGLATGHELFYSYDYGNTHFVSLNSELGSLLSTSNDWIGVNLFSSFSTSPLTDWLHADLTANTQPWVIVYFHQPPYTDGSHQADAAWEVYMQAMRENITPILEQHHVDMVVCGHSHVYERSKLVEGFYGDINSFNAQTMVVNNGSGVDSLGEAYYKFTAGSHANKGTLYVVNGNSGSSETAPGLTHPVMQAGYGCDSCVGSLVLDILDNRIDGRHLNANGEIIDHFTLIKTADTTLVNSVKEIPKSLPSPISNINVFPNPFSKVTQLNFELASPEYLNIGLADLHERVITLAEGQFKAGQNSITIDAEKLGLSQGVYGVAISTNTKVLSRKVLHVK